MKLTNLFLVLLLLFAIVFTFAACGGSGDPGDPSGPSNPSDSSEPSGPSSPALKDITGVTFASQSFDYDGSDKKIEVSGTLPAGVSVNYTNNKGTDANTYNATAVLSGEGYNTLTLNATLTINKIDMTGLSLSGATTAYDGAEHNITLVGNVPEGSTVTYTGGENGKNGATNAGNYSITVTVNHKNYNTFTATANLVITKIDFQNLEFKGASFTYDTQMHVIALTGNVPGDAVVTYTGGENGKNGATNVGSYTITVTVQHKNYNAFTATAVIKITTSEESLSVFFSDGNVYFQNTLDEKYLYIYDGTDLEFAGRDKPSSVIEVGSELYYVANGLFSSGIYQYNPKTNKSQCLYEVSAVDQIVSDGTYIYYNVNKLVGGGNENGIYRVKIEDLENGDADIVPTRITSVKTADMVYAEGRIYFSNKADGGKLYSVSASATNATPAKLYDYKVSDLITDGTKLYFVREITLTNLSMGAAIYSINVSGGLSTLQDDDSFKVVKITVSKGKHLTIIGDYIYFVNTDVVTSTIFGDGIYRAKKDGSGWISDAYMNLVGATKIVDGSEDSIFGLATDGETLYYYRANTKHLFSCDIDTKEETDLMAGFVVPEKAELILSTHEKAELYNGEIYYINMKDGGKLYKYNATTGLDIRITNLPVSDFAINDGVIYYSAARLLVNYDLYCMNLTTGELKLISKEKCSNFSFYGGKMYFTCFSGTNTLNALELETLTITEIFGKNIVADGKSVDDGLTAAYNGKIYFVADNLLYAYDVSAGTFAVVNKDVKPSEYLIYDDKILMMNTDGSNKAIIYEIASDTLYTVADLKGSISTAFQPDDIRSFYVYKNELYYYRNITVGSDKKGLYKVVKNGNNYEAVLVDDMDGYYMCEAVVIGDKVYFLDVWQVKGAVPTTSSTAKLCVLDMITKKITVLN